MPRIWGRSAHPDPHLYWIKYTYADRVVGNSNAGSATPASGEIIPDEPDETPHDNTSSVESTVSYQPPYRYSLIAVDDVKQHVLNNAGVGKLDDCF